MNSLERHVRRLLRDACGVDHAVSKALRGCSPKRRALLTQVLLPRPSGLSERSYYRAKKELVERVGDILSQRPIETRKRANKRANDVMPIALPMVDRLVPEPIRPEGYRGPDRGRALSAAALSAEMSGDRERADTLISEAGNNVRDQFDRRDVASEFEVSQNELFIARCRGDLSAMRRAVRTMAKLYERLSPAAQMKFALDCSEVYLYEGRLRDARSELDFASLNASHRDGTLLQSIALVRKAQLALAHRDLRAAEDAAETAANVGQLHADIRVYAAEVLGRSALQSGNPWSSDGLEECQSVFHALCLRTVLARHRLQRGHSDAASEMAEQAYEEATRLRYWNLASRSAFTLAVCSASNEACAWVTEALRLYLISKRQNAFLGDDLFEIGPRGRTVVRSFLESNAAVPLMKEVYVERFPDSVFQGEFDSLLGRVTLFILRGALDGQSAPMIDVFSPAAKQWSRTIRLQEIERGISRLGSLLAALAVLLPFEERVQYVAANRHRTREALHAVRRSLARHHWNALRRFPE